MEHVFIDFYSGPFVVYTMSLGTDYADVWTVIEEFLRRPDIESDEITTIGIRRIES